MNRPKQPNPTTSNPVSKGVLSASVELPILEEIPPMDERVAPQEDSEGVNEILISPSPVKPIPNKPITINRVSQTNGIHSNGMQKKPKSPGSRKQRNSNDQKSNDSEDTDVQADSGHDSDEHEDSQVIRDDNDDEENDKPSQQTNEALFEVALLANMATIASRVGHHYDMETGTYNFVVEKKVMSANGMRIIRPINKLLSAYEDLRIANNSADIQAAKMAKTAVRRLIQNLKVETESVLTRRLGNPSLGIEFFGEVKTRTMLQDLYFNIFPALVDVMKVAAEVYPPERSIKTFALRQFLDLVTMLEDLAKTAEIQPKDFQPKPPSKSKSKTYQVLRPTQLLMPNIRKIRKTLSAELTRRKRGEDAAEHQKRLPDLEKRKREEEQRQDAELEARLRNRRREQAEAFAKLLAQPIWGRLITDQITEMEGSSGRGRDSTNRSVRGNRSRSAEYDQNKQDDYDPFAEEGDGLDQVDDDVDRISVFGRNNKNDRSRPLSAKEKEVFVECMMRERGMSYSSLLIVRD